MSEVPTAGVQPQEPRKAATVILVKPGELGLEILLLKRNAALAFAGGLWVFPGGALDPEDIEQAGQDELLALKLAAAREVQEEAGVLISAEQLYLFNHWTTPELEKKRFATWFFVHILEDDQGVQIDDSEIKDSVWKTPAAALEAHEQGEMGLFPPTYLSLQFLDKFNTADELTAALDGHETLYVLPKAYFRGKDFGILLEGDAGYSAGDPEQTGARHRVIMTQGICSYERESLSQDTLPLLG